MTQLTKGMYGREFSNTSNLFDIRCGQIRNLGLTHNSGWYNRVGEKLGWGDLSVNDLETIALGLDEGELFVILPEDASFWHFVTQPGLIGSMSEVNSNVDAPGVDYMVREATYVIARHQVYIIDRYSDHEDGSETELRGLGPGNKTISAKYLAVGSLKAMLAHPAAP